MLGFGDVSLHASCAWLFPCEFGCAATCVWKMLFPCSHPPPLALTLLKIPENGNIPPYLWFDKINIIKKSTLPKSIFRFNIQILFLGSFLTKQVCLIFIKIYMFVINYWFKFTYTKPICKVVEICMQGFEIYNEKQKTACLFQTNDLFIKLFLFLRAFCILYYLVFISLL